MFLFLLKYIRIALMDVGFEYHNICNDPDPKIRSTMSPFHYVTEDQGSIRPIIGPPKSRWMLLVHSGIKELLINDTIFPLVTNVGWGLTISPTQILDVFVMAQLNRHQDRTP